MVAPIRPQDFDLVLKFGGGLHTRASEDEIDIREAADGQNFLLDLENRELRNRKPFDLVGTAPNGAEIRGGFTLLKSDGTVSTCFQAGGTVYEWDGEGGFASVGTVSSSARLRGRWRTHNFTLDDKVLITDLELVETIKEWNGTTFQSSSFTNGSASGASFGNFFAKYLTVSNERAVFANVRDVGGFTPHMIVGSERGSYQVISVGQRPSSSLSEEDPFFLLSPDLRPINGLQEAFGTTIISTEQGQIFNLEGASAKDFSFSDFYPGSAASGDESMAYIGNDIVYGRKGRIESVRDTDRFGDSEANDLTRAVANAVETYTGWKTVYNSRINRAYAFPNGVSECWALNTAMMGGEISPWMRWTTNHPLAFQPTFVMSMLDPMDGLEYVFMGDVSGNIYRMEGSGADGDGGSSDIPVEWLTKLYSMPAGAEFNSVEGYIKYRKNVAASVSLRFEYAGQTAANETVTITIPAITDAPHFGGNHYFGGDVFFGAAFENRLLRQKFLAPGQAADLQVRVQVEGSTNFSINEIGLRFRVAS